MGHERWCPPAAPRPKPDTARCDGVVDLRPQLYRVHRLLDEQVAAAAARTQSTPAAHGEVLSMGVQALCVEDTAVNVLLRARPLLVKSVWIDGRSPAGWSRAAARPRADPPAASRCDVRGRVAAWVVHWYTSSWC